MWSRNTVRESSHISFFRDGDPFCEEMRRPKNTHGGADRFTWVTSGSLPLVQNYWPYIVFSNYGWLSELTYFRFFSGNLLILSANGNICHSINRQWITFSPSSFIFLFPVKLLCWCYLATALNLLSSSNTLRRQLIKYMTQTRPGFELVSPCPFVTLCG